MRDLINKLKRKDNDLNSIRSLDEIGGESDEKIKMKKIEPKSTEKKARLSKKAKLILFSTAGIILILLLTLGVHAYLVYEVYKEARITEAQARMLMDSVRGQNLDEIRSNLANTRMAVNRFDQKYKTIEFMRRYPIAGVYVKDGRHAINAANHGMDAAEIMIQAIEPYADIIGLTGEDVHISGEQTAKDRLDFVVATIGDVIPRAEELVEKIELVREEIDNIDPQDYPQEFAGYSVRPQLQMAVDSVDQGAELVKTGKPLLESAPYLLGAEDQRTYLILFQNDKELRPTGGFLTAYSIANVLKGKFEPVSSDDIYNLDERYTPSIPAPDPIIDYLKGPYILSSNFRLRDLNWSPDFELSMEQFLTEAQKAGIGEVDGIIGVDTQVLVNLLEVLGPIGVPGYGEFSNKIIDECNCPQVVYELESFADNEGPIVWDPVTGEIVFAPPNIDNRKKIIGPLMNSILSNALGQSKEKIPALFEAGFISLLEKHVLVYAQDDRAQEALETFGIAGKIEEYNGDYLHVNDANLGGRKSNMYVTHEVLQEMEIQGDGSVIKTVTLTYKNPEKQDGWLNSVLPNWVRIYVPEGSELLSLEGLDDMVDPYTDLGKTVFSGYFELRPQGVSKVTAKYRLPMKFSDEYQLLMQKQPGKDKPLYSIHIGEVAKEEFFLKEDTELIYELD